jgi:hypothetical protein
VVKTKRVRAIKACRLAGSSLSITTKGVSAGAPTSSRTAASLLALRPPMAHRRPDACLSKYSITKRPVNPVAPCTTMSNSFIHPLSFMHKAGHANSGSCDNAKTTVALLAWIEN